MPTPITHAVVGASLAQVAPEGVSRWWLAAGLAVVAAAPDLDVVAFLMDIPYEHPFGHRGFFHSLLFAALIGVAAAALVAVCRKGRRRTAWVILPLVFLAVASHGLLDAMTTGGRGVALLIPFTSDRFFFGLRPIAVSPIGMFSTLSQLQRVMLSELIWVWCPVAAASIVIQVARRMVPRAWRHHTPGSRR